MTTPDEPRGREFLTKVRPEAMNHLLAFFKESGKHLEPKTRMLISVVTKTINFSPRGLKQYIKRAMEAGASKDEVLDAILCSYPCAGLTKVCDAATVFLDMGLGDAPAAAPAAAAPAPGNWMALDGAGKIAEGDMRRFSLDGLPVCVSRHGGKLYAISDVCPHRGGSLSDGECEAGVITCGLHGWNFHAKDGSSAGIGQGGATAYEVREAGDKAEIRIPTK
jgi:nitrite reductase/ring-hydroxylating ferredoxin subunit/alkylhydroperoxidase/carboxymuconolactone decarboxylase family protein YurZ